MNLSLSRCTRLHVCCTSSVALQENQVMVQTGTYVVFSGRCYIRMGVCTMMHSQLAYVYHGSRTVKCWPFLYYCYSFTVPLVRMTTIHSKIFADFVNRPCLQRTRTMRRATQFALRDHFRIKQTGTLICKILFTKISVSLFCQ